ncbi:DUF4238 domain-containing protein [Rufibacter sediminis]|uniref:DUF4238 domain-containing protein n=1 Tax=Rufibacter sediminis TaxID=2762756 RepID=A0ABR6VU42_9BACT|nr:DUF4238 domain-containing protein [Rufibacter sediminis]MBC3540414.1 DUF4238 domain-containing protein [Rufibacter sediminis]
MAISNRHHYIPRFLIDKFTDSDKKVWVYNKIEGRIQKNKQSSKSIFFEMGRNNFDINGEKADNIEQLYGEVDNLLSKNLEKVLSTHSMSGRELTLLILLVSLTKWRIPSSDERFKSQFQDIPSEQLGLAIRPIGKTESDEEALKKIKEMDFIKEVNRLLLPIQPLLREENLNEIHKNCFIVSHEDFPSLLGDTPIIESLNTSYETLGNFIFPLSKNETLVCKRGTSKKNPQTVFYIQKDLTMFHLAQKYVVCKSKEHLLNIARIHQTLLQENKAHLLTKYIFNFFD